MRIRKSTSLSTATTPMLKKLRTKFVALNMATVAVVLVVVFAAICIINHQQSVNSVYSALDSAISRAADATKQPFSSTPGNLSESDAAPLAPVGPDSARQSEPAPPEIGGKHNDRDSVIPVAVYTVESDGTLALIPDITTASISEDMLEEAAVALSSEGDGQGFLSAFGLFFAKRNAGDTTYVAFADASSASAWQTLALTLAGVGAGALVIFLAISIFFARWSLRPVEAAWQQQQQFVADASHELKTPLTVILANTAILRAHPEHSIASQSQWIESTQTEAERMQELVCDMLELAKPVASAAQKGHVFEQVNLTDLVEGDLLQFESVAFERGVDLESTVEPNVSVTGNPTRLHRLASTLLDNACKYAGKNGTVTVSLAACERFAMLRVNNTGTPIAPDDLPHVFDRFYRADKARTAARGSYGLGLAIAQEIAREHSGTITATSTPSEGTTFTVKLPLA